jgi:hypothetical protein
VLHKRGERKKEKEREERDGRKKLTSMKRKVKS